MRFELMGELDLSFYFLANKDIASVKYISTRGEAPALSFEDVLLAGLARDGGLYVPQTWPELSSETIACFAGRPFAVVAAEVISPFVGETISKADLVDMAEDAYHGFAHPAVTPVVQIGCNRFVLELFHGPTLAFKDIAMQLLARLMDHVLQKRHQRATIVGATSGDTGGAAIEAFRGSSRADVFIFFPEGRVSDVQRRMMTTPKDKNVHAVAVRGTFDDCQSLVKGMFNHHAFRDRVHLSGVNSINWARIMAQVTYYFVAGVALGAPYRKISFVVPTGNFGDIFAGYVAKKMGLPIERLVIASNSNDILPRTHRDGVYELRDVVATTSPSMDIQVSSNFERYLFEALNRDGKEVRGRMNSLAQSGRFEIGPAQAQFRRDFDAYGVSEEEVASSIKRLAGRGYVIDPHTACGVVAGERAMKDASTPQVILSTAHPAKFPDAISEITGHSPELPAHHSKLMREKESYGVIDNDLSVAERFVAERTRALTSPTEVDGGSA